MGRRKPEWAEQDCGRPGSERESHRSSLALYDIDYDAARPNEKMASEVFDHPALTTRFHVRAEKHLVDALRGADFVIISIEPGPTLLAQHRFRKFRSATEFCRQLAIPPDRGDRSRLAEHSDFSPLCPFDHGTLPAGVGDQLHESHDALCLRA